MGKTMLSGLHPRVKLSIYWLEKERFLLYEDTYDIWVMFAIESGSFYYEIGDQKGSATFGDLVLCPPGVPFRRVINTPLTFYYFELTWRPSDEGPPHDESMLPIGKISLFDTSRLTHNYNLMRKWQSWPSDISLPQYSHYCLDIWLLYCDELGEGFMQSISSKSIQTDPLMQEAQSLIQQHAFSQLNLRTVAADLGISPAQLTKRFSACYGITPLRYLTSLRLEKAKTLLLETRMTIDSISECCGYQNGFYLNRVFVKNEKTTPSQYRKASRL
ncbi:helix-turn-helix domain-containing protein [Paenibacillus sp. GCM10012303]|jgi:AraC-like DNA-binding protein|uniref:helix-turn-helix domain-containing protein n=1 Tax=Paenibacillus sp. GCM10012303 TaxID=3317340 RepID=UPI00360B529B